jgi:(R,R)-butanediol dehydrogenase/meso-butanediol dehydrogenase/diacetyl reductase
MKAVRYIAPDTIAVQEVPIPKPAAGEVLVKVRYAGICGSDLSIAAGSHPRAKPPLILGHEMAGEIVDISQLPPGTGWAVGDRVTANPMLSCGDCRACRDGFYHVCLNMRVIGIDDNGFMAEYAQVPAEKLHRIPAGLPYAAGALIEQVAVGVHALSMGAVTQESKVLVVGAGPIGLVTALCLRHQGVEDIRISDLNDYRLSLAARLQFKALDAREGEARLIEEFAADSGADVVFEAAGSEEAIAQAVQLARPRGRIVVVSVHKTPHAVDLRAVNFKELTIVGSRMYAHEDFAAAVAMANALPIGELATHTIPLQEASQAFALAANPIDAGKVLIEI